LIDFPSPSANAFVKPSNGASMFKHLFFLMCFASVINAAESNQYISLDDAVTFMNSGKKEQVAYLDGCCACQDKDEQDEPCPSRACGSALLHCTGGIMTVASAIIAPVMTGLSQPCCMACCCPLREAIFNFVYLKVGISFWVTGFTGLFGPTILVVTINGIRNYYIYSENERIVKGVARLGNIDEKWRELSEDDVETIADFLFVAPKDVLLKMNLEQAMALARVDPDRFFALAEELAREQNSSFASKIAPYATKLKQFLECEETHQRSLLRDEGFKNDYGKPAFLKTLKELHDRLNPEVKIDFPQAVSKKTKKTDAVFTTLQSDDSISLEEMDSDVAQEGENPTVKMDRICCKKGVPGDTLLKKFEYVSDNKLEKSKKKLIGAFVVHLRDKGFDKEALNILQLLDENDWQSVVDNYSWAQLHKVFNGDASFFQVLWDLSVKKQWLDLKAKLIEFAKKNQNVVSNAFKLPRHVPKELNFLNQEKDTI